MGQGQSQEGGPSIEVLSHRLTENFATNCLSPLELYIFKSVFKAHATTSSGLTYWTQSTLATFLELPDHPGLPIAHVIFQLASYIGAFPFPSQAPAILTNDALLRVIVVLTGRHGRVLRGGRRMWEREIWRGLAVFDRGLEPSGQGSDNNSTVANTQSSTGFAVDESKDEPGEDDDDEELVLSAFDALDASEIFRHGETSNIQHAMIPTDNFLTLVMFLLLIAPLSNEESVSTYFKDLDADKLQDVRNHAYSILTSFGVERHPGISFKTFRKVMTTTLPHLLDSIRPFFEHFFYSKDFDLHKRQGAPAAPIEEVEPQNKSTTLLRPIIPSPTGELLTPATLSHLSFIVPPAILMRNLTLLYTGAEDGFSLPTFQNSVFNWSSPTILLISGSILSEHPASGQARSFMSGLPYRRFKSSAMPSQTVVYGAYIPEKWKQTHKSGFGTKETVLFQIYPQHDVFPGSSTATSYIYFNRYPSTYTGLGLGSYLAEQNNASAARGQTMIRRRSSVDDKIPLGPVSLHMDDSLTYAAFTHDSRGGGAFEPSKLPPSCRLTPSEESNSSMNANRSSVSSPVTSPPLSPLFKTSSPSPTAAPLAAPLTDWQDVFEIEQLEVYGLGGQEVAEEQRRARLWEEREAERRRAVTMKTGDLDADRELLKMAGLIGQNQSGGSMA